MTDRLGDKKGQTKTMEEEITKQEQEKMVENQAECCNFECSSRRLQLISLNYNQIDTTILSLLCLQCGLIQQIHLKSGVMINHKTETSSKIEGSYLG